MTIEQKYKRIEELREAWRQAKNDVDRKIIEARASMIKRTMHTLV